MRARHLPLIALVMLSRSAWAEETDFAGMLLMNQSLLSDPPSDCGDNNADHNTFELQQCAAVAFRDADRAMTVAYQAALKAGAPAENEKLKAGQRSWLAFRNQECDWESSQYSGGSLAPVVMGKCLVGITRVRAKQLKDVVER